MQARFEEIFPGIYRLRVPFDSIDTAVFAVSDGGQWIVSDSASSDEDAAQYILPALQALGCEPQWLILSHAHGDHSGGLAALIERFPQARIGLMSGAFAAQHPAWDCHLLADGERLTAHVRALHLPGHADDALGLLDLRSGTLLSHDCLQLRGVGRFGTSLRDPAAYLRTLARLREMEIGNLAASHEYVPLGALARGREAVAAYLRQCEEIVQELRAFARQHDALPGSEIAAQYHAAFPNLPPVPARTMENLLA